MRSTLLAVLCVSIVGCGDDGGGTPVDAINVPAMITVTGTATKREGLTMGPAAGVTIGAYRKDNENTAVVMTTTDAQGNYTLVIPTNGAPIDGFLKSTFTGFMDTYLYPPKPLVADFSGASMNILTTGTLDTLSGTLCGSAQDGAKAAVALLVVDGNNAPVGMAMVDSAPKASKVCYNQSGFPNKAATVTDTDGIAYLLNVTAGEVTVSATKAGLTFQSHKVTARVGTFTTTVIQP